MNAETLQRYQPGGDIYRTVMERYGLAGAESVRSAADDDFRTGEPGRVAEELARLRHGNPLPEGTGGILIEQLATDPFGAPLDAAERGLENVSGSIIGGLFRNPLVLGALILGGWLWWTKGRVI